MQILQTELKYDCKPKVKTISKNQVTYDKILFINNMSSSNLTWKDVAGLF